MTTIHAPATTGERLTRARLWIGIDQHQMATLLGKTRQTVSNWERDAVEPPFSAVARWARITGRSLDWIAYGDESEEAPESSGASDRSRPRESNPRPFHYELQDIPDTAADLIAAWTATVPAHATDTLG